MKYKISPDLSFKNIYLINPLEPPPNVIWQPPLKNHWRGWEGEGCPAPPLSSPRVTPPSRPLRPASGLVLMVMRAKRSTDTNSSVILSFIWIMMSPSTATNQHYFMNQFPAYSRFPSSKQLDFTHVYVLEEEVTLQKMKNHSCIIQSNRFQEAHSKSI